MFVENLFANGVQTSYLLLYGELPTASEMETFKLEIRKHMLLKKNLLDFFDHFPTGAHPMVSNPRLDSAQVMPSEHAFCAQWPTLLFF